ncbi:hypothetical protein HDZ31DRAFT_33731 [Schizophyllum fasciatum]
MMSQNQNRPLPGTGEKGMEQNGMKPYQEDAFKPAYMRRPSDTAHGARSFDAPHGARPPDAALTRRPSEPLPAPHRDAYTAQHNEALRMALGSILSPKRPFSPTTTSHPASGTASPAFLHALPFAAAGAQTPHPEAAAHAAQHGPVAQHLPANQHHPPTQHAHLPPTHHLHAHWPGYPHHHSDPHNPYHPHTPSRLGPGEEGAGEAGHPALGSGHAALGSREASHPPSRGELAAGEDVHVPAPLPVMEVGNTPSTAGAVPHSGDGTPSSGAGTPRAKFLDTLHGKSAWDALIHGSFS